MVNNYCIVGCTNYVNKRKTYDFFASLCRTKSDAHVGQLLSEESTGYLQETLGFVGSTL